MKPIKPPTIRSGQRRPYVKGTQAQIDQRRGFVARMLDQNATKTEIHSAVREKFNVEWRQCDRYLAFVSGTRTRTNTRLARAPAQTYRQTAQYEESMKLIKMYQDAVNQELHHNSECVPYMTKLAVPNDSHACANEAK
jgi:ribosomal protein L23